VALHVDPRIGQLLAMNPDSPLGVSKKNVRTSSYISTKQISDGVYRKIVPVLLFGVFLSVNARVLLVRSFTPTAGGRSKVPAPKPPGKSWDELGWAK